MSPQMLHIHLVGDVGELGPDARASHQLGAAGRGFHEFSRADADDRARAARANSHRRAIHHRDICRAAQIERFGEGWADAKTVAAWRAEAAKKVEEAVAKAKTLQ